MIVSLYVDGLLIIGIEKKKIEDFKRSLVKQFEMGDLGKMNYFLGLGLEGSQEKDDIFICQKKYAQGILEKFKKENCEL